ILSGGRDPMEVAQGAGLKEQCLDCHADSTGLHQWDRGAHHNAGLDCLTCHDLLQERRTTIRFPEQQLCASCHGAQVAEFHANSSHPLGEGGLQCSDCHDVHGQSGTLLDQRQLRERCEECHRSQSGPFAHGHEADRFDGCLACHEAHGSPNRKLLTAEPVRLLCLQCHADTPLNHNQQPLSVFQNCLSCHTEIHGSNLDRRLFR
ncbi:MAG: cytochrome c3 family protein, partial [Planctomycetes bacterium]|nr:cytochrome c3 family protein [Planctomycetota bacterium]